MSSSLAKFGSWLARKAALSAVAIIAGFAAVGVWLFLHDSDGYSAGTDDLMVRRAVCRVAAGVLSDHAASLDAAIAAEEKRDALANRVIVELKADDNFWNRFFAEPEQQATNDARMAEAMTLRKGINGRLRELRMTRADNARKLAFFEGRIAALDTILADQGLRVSPARHYARESWRVGRLYVAALLAAVWFGPTLFFVACFYLLAPWVTRGRPLRLGEAKAPALSASASRPTIEKAVWPGEVLLARKKFLASADDGLARRTRAVLSWRFPLSSLLCGLGGLAEVRNARSAGGLPVTLAARGGEGVEFTRVEVPEGGALVARPGFVAAVLCASGRSPVVRGRWRIFCWQSWTSGQFRFLEFAGPCRLILATRSALRVEALGQSAEVGASSARARLDAVVGFTPTLECRPARAVSFWRYYVGEAALFETAFSGAGLVVQAAGADGEASTWRRVLKLAGL